MFYKCFSFLKTTIKAARRFWATHRQLILAGVTAIYFIGLILLVTIGSQPH